MAASSYPKESYLKVYLYTRLQEYNITLSLLSTPAMLGYPDGSVGAAIVAVVLIHTVIAGYVYVAWKDGPTTIQFKQD